MELDSEITKAIVQNIGLHWSNKEQCDLQVIIGAHHFSCNQFLLCACSEFFRILLHSESRGLNQTNVFTLVIKGIKHDIFSHILRMIFKGESRIPEENMIELWYAAHHLQINFILQKCEQFVSDHLTDDNYLNIYHHAFILKSERVLDQVLRIMIKNFEYFRQTETFLKLPMQTLLTVITSKNLKSHDNVIESILDWVNYDSAENRGDTSLNYTAALDSEDVNSKNNKSLGASDWNIEVIFSNNRLALVSEESHVKREDMLGDLISHIHFDLVSIKSLRMLLDSDIVMENRDARNAVRRAISLQLEHEKLVKNNLNVNSEDTLDTPFSIAGISLDSVFPAGSCDFPDAITSKNFQHVVIFLDRYRNLIAHNLLTNQLYHIRLEVEASNEDVMVCNNQLYLLMNHSPSKAADLLKLHKVSPSLQSSVLVDCFAGPPHVIKFIINGLFLYGFMSHSKTALKICRIKYSENTFGKWTTCDEFVDRGVLVSLVNFRDEIIGVFSASNTNKDMIIMYSFNTTNRILHRIAAMTGNPRNLVTFNFRERLFVLEGNGNLTEIVIRDGLLKAEFQPALWNETLTIFGAIILNKTLYVLANLHERRDFPTSCQFGSMKFVHLYNSTNACQYMIVHKDWLKNEI